MLTDGICNRRQVANPDRRAAGLIGVQKAIKQHCRQGRRITRPRRLRGSKGLLVMVCGPPAVLHKRLLRLSRFQRRRVT
jgi:hypothetical protein